MLDYKLLEALSAVVELSGFEKAGASLGLTQSAVTQRIKLLETRLGQAVLIRTPTLKPTELGKQLLSHVRQVQLLEHDLRMKVPVLGMHKTHLRVALNADSLATWWTACVADYCRENRILLDIVIEDQNVGLKRMRDGEVAGCICSSEQAVQGARAVYLGSITYRAYARQDYIDDYFKNGLNDSTLSSAPAIVFGPYDQLHETFLRKLGYSGVFPYHICPSSEGFAKMIMAGAGYGILPDIQVVQEVNNGQLIWFAKEHTIEVPLYWHYWRQGGALLEGLTSQLLNAMPLEKNAKPY